MTKKMSKGTKKGKEKSIKGITKKNVYEGYEKDFWNEKRDDLSSLLLLPKINSLLDFVYTQAGILRSKDQHKWVTKDYKPTKVLEIGFGYGGGIIYWSRKGYDITGVEPDQRSVDRINQKVHRRAAFCSKIEDFKAMNNYDLIILSHALEHLPDLDEFFRVISAMQKNKGAVFIEVPDCENKETLRDSKSNKAHVYHFTTSSLTKEFKKHGYNVIKCEELISKIDQITKKSLPKYKRFARLVKVILAKDKSVVSTSEKADTIRLLAVKK